MKHGTLIGAAGVAVAGAAGYLWWKKRSTSAVSNVSAGTRVIRAPFGMSIKVPGMAFNPPQAIPRAAVSGGSLKQGLCDVAGAAVAAGAAAKTGGGTAPASGLISAGSSAIVCGAATVGIAAGKKIASGAQAGASAVASGASKAASAGKSVLKKLTPFW